MGEFGIVGDPDGMRALADAMVKDASQLRTACGQVKAAKRSLSGGGPKAAGWSVASDTAITAYSSAADSLDQAAKLLRSSAKTVGDQIETARKRAADEAQRQREAQR